MRSRGTGQEGQRGSRHLVAMTEQLTLSSNKGNGIWNGVEMQRIWAFRAHLTSLRHKRGKHLWNNNSKKQDDDMAVARGIQGNNNPYFLCLSSSVLSVTHRTAQQVDWLRVPKTESCVSNGRRRRNFRPHVICLQTIYGKVVTSHRIGLTTFWICQLTSPIYRDVQKYIPSSSSYSRPTCFLAAFQVFKHQKSRVMFYLCTFSL